MRALPVEEIWALKSPKFPWSAGSHVHGRNGLHGFMGKDVEGTFSRRHVMSDDLSSRRSVLRVFGFGLAWLFCTVVLVSIRLTVKYLTLWEVH